MTNKDLLRSYVNGDKMAAVVNHLGYSGNELINYSTVICTINREEKRAVVNVEKYSTTTSKIQNYLLAELQAAGYEIETYKGGYCYYWNAGYMGARKLKMADVI